MDIFGYKAYRWIRLITLNLTIPDLSTNSKILVPPLVPTRTYDGACTYIGKVRDI